MPKVPQELKEAHVSWEVIFANAPKYLQVRLQQGKQALGSILMPLTTGAFLPRMIDIRMHKPFKAR